VNAGDLKVLKSSLAELLNKQDSQLLMAQTRQLALAVLAADPINQEALNAMVSVEIIAKRPSEARDWALRLVAEYPGDKTSYFRLGLSDWAAVYYAVRAAHDTEGIRPDDSTFIGDAGTRRAFRSQYGPLIDEGMRMLETALSVDPQYFDAMNYTNLLYRVKAYISETEAEATCAEAKADEWVDKALCTPGGGVRARFSLIRKIDRNC
jgi:hypothetical protein